MSDMEQDKTPLEVALEVLVYAPLGFALEARTLLPRFIDRGRNQIVLAKVIGKYAVRKGEAAAEKVMQQAPDPAAGLFRLVGLTGDAPPVPEVSDSDSPPEAAGRAVAGNGASGANSPKSQLRAVPRTRGEAPFDPAALAIPGYDSLSASQVVPRLDGLQADELEQVRTYELATRGRKTILSKISRLQSA